MRTAPGIALAFRVAPGLLLAMGDARAAGDDGLTANAWVHITPRGTILIQCPTSEMGQGIMTSLPLLVAEELDARWQDVRVVQAGASPAFLNPVHFRTQGVGGSRSMRGYWLPMRLAGAQARRVLLANAAEHWSVPVAELVTADGRVSHAATARSMGYGQIAAFARVPAGLALVTEAELKPRSAWRLIGRDQARVDVPAKVNGTAIYGIDVRLDGMLHASILRPPVATFPHPQFAPDIGIAPRVIDDRGALAIDGVLKIIPLAHGVAVVADDYWASVLGKRALKVEWQHGHRAESYDSEKVLEEFAAIARDPARRGQLRETGKGDEAFAMAASIMASEFASEHAYHAAMEPQNATAWVRGDAVDLWTPTQGQLWAQEVAAKAAGTVPAKVRVHTMLLGGGFGLKTEQLVNEEAVLLSKAMQRPVKVTWNREDDMQNGAYRPATAQRLEAALSADGRIAAWRMRLVADSVTLRARKQSWEQTRAYDVVVMSGATSSYTIPHKRHEYIHEARGIAAGYLNANGAGFTVFAVESFVDEIAAKLGQDPLAFRLGMSSNPRARQVLEGVAEMADWRRKRPGRGLGVAYYDGGEWNCPCAQVAEVSVDRLNGAITVHKLWAAIEPGIAVQPAHLIQQARTGIVYGVGLALRERITIKAGVVQEANFNDYQVTRAHEMPDIEVRIVGGSNSVSGGGQIGVAPVAPAIANAVAALTGVRLRRLPMLAGRVKAALQA
ncbi:MAG: xanthine dehydrogenase family protein molybdopterin-binding subunit [Burkholderiales bacterium]|nr:xanthine dehydrogenase family protein molybdopterin-binding subunit [Burkholderiales bacterium]